jgi:hypothetical protein
MKKRGKNLSPRNKTACHSISTALLQSVAEKGTQSTIKSSTKTLHEFSPHIPQKRRKGKHGILLVWKVTANMCHFIGGGFATNAKLTN